MSHRPTDCDGDAACGGSSQWRWLPRAAAAALCKKGGAACPRSARKTRRKREYGATRQWTADWHQALPPSGANGVVLQAPTAGSAPGLSAVSLTADATARCIVYLWRPRTRHCAPKILVNHVGAKNGNSSVSRFCRTLKIPSWSKLTRSPPPRRLPSVERPCVHYDPPHDGPRVASVR